MMMKMGLKKKPSLGDYVAKMREKKKKIEPAAAEAEAAAPTSLPVVMGQLEGGLREAEASGGGAASSESLQRADLSDPDLYRNRDAVTDQIIEALGVLASEAFEERLTQRTITNELRPGKREKSELKEAGAATATEAAAKKLVESAPIIPLTDKIFAAYTLLQLLVAARIRPDQKGVFNKIYYKSELERDSDRPSWRTLKDRLSTFPSGQYSTDTTELSASPEAIDAKIELFELFRQGVDALQTFVLDDLRDSNGKSTDRALIFSKREFLGETLSQDKQIKGCFHVLNEKIEQDKDFKRILNEALITAIILGHDETTEGLLASGADPNYQEEKEIILLSHQKIGDYLGGQSEVGDEDTALEEVHTRYILTKTPLDSAIGIGKVSIVDILINKGASITKEHMLYAIDLWKKAVDDAGEKSAPSAAAAIEGKHAGSKATEEALFAIMQSLLEKVTIGIEDLSGLDATKHAKMVNLLQDIKVKKGHFGGVGDDGRPGIELMKTRGGGGQPSGAATRGGGDQTSVAATRGGAQAKPRSPPQSAAAAAAPPRSKGSDPDKSTTVTF